LGFPKPLIGNQVKHLLIILSILLLSSPLFGQETGVLFLSLENGELVYYEEGDDDNEGKYVGEIKNGRPNGQGTFTFLNGTKYVGEYKDGLENGQGTYTHTLGLMEESMWGNGRTGKPMDKER